MPGLQHEHARTQRANEGCTAAVVVAVMVDSRDVDMPRGARGGTFDVAPRQIAVGGGPGEIAAREIRERPVRDPHRARAHVLVRQIGRRQAGDRREVRDGAIVPAVPDLAVRRDVPHGERLSGGRRVHRPQLRRAADREALRSHAARRRRDERAIVVQRRVAPGRRVVVARVAAVDHAADRNELGDVGDSGEAIGAEAGLWRVRDVAHMIGMEVRQQGCVDAGGARLGEPALHVARDPLTGAARAVRAQRRQQLRIPAHRAGVDQQRRAVGKDAQRRVAPARTDVVNLERTAGPSAPRPARRGGQRPDCCEKTQPIHGGLVSARPPAMPVSGADVARECSERRPSPPPGARRTIRCRIDFTTAC